MIKTKILSTTRIGDLHAVEIESTLDLSGAPDRPLGGRAYRSIIETVYVPHPYSDEAVQAQIDHIERDLTQNQ